MRFAVALVIVFGLGCSQRAVVSLQPQPRDFSAKSYRKVYRTWTREKKNFSWGKLQDVLNVAATFESWEFRWAYVIRYAHDYRLSPEEREQMLQASLAEAEREHRFFVTLSGDRFPESNLTGKQSGWRLSLAAPGGAEVAPKAIERIRRPSAVDRAYFPTVTPLRETFRITFPAVDEAGRAVLGPNPSAVALRFSGAHGHVDLRWDLSK